MKLTRIVSVAAIAFSGYFAVGCGAFGDLLPDIDEVTRYIPEDFQCSQVGFIELKELVDDNVLNDTGFFKDLFGSAEEYEDDVIGRIYNYLFNFNQTLRSKCNVNYAGLYDYCKFEWEEKNDLLYPIREIYETEKLNASGWPGTYRQVLQTMGPLSAFGIYSSTINHRLGLPLGPTDRENLGDGPLVFVNHKNYVEKHASSSQQEDEDLPGDYGDFKRALDCYEDALGDDNDHDERDLDYPDDTDYAGDWDDEWLEGVDSKYWDFYPVE